MIVRQFWTVVYVVILIAWAKSQRPKIPCKTPNAEVGYCVVSTECPKILAIINNEPISDANKTFLHRNQCGYFEKIPYVCCDASPKLKLLPEFNKCTSTTSEKIYGGSQTKIDDFPWTALIIYQNEQTGAQTLDCGGSLINERYVLTAAHCVATERLERHVRPTAVRLGEWDTNKELDCDRDTDIGDEFVNLDCVNEPVQDINIERIIPNEDYDRKNYDQHDIALLRLETPAVLNHFVKPICLPRTEALLKRNLEGMSLVTAGWGQTESDQNSAIKMWVDLPAVPLANCIKIFPKRKITNKQLCAGGVKGKDSCRGDSGGPLMKLEKGVKIPYWYLVGVVSYGQMSCGMENNPAVYTKVSEYFEWILAKINL